MCRFLVPGRENNQVSDMAVCYLIFYLILDGQLMITILYRKDHEWFSNLVCYSKKLTVVLQEEGKSKENEKERENSNNNTRYFLHYIWWDVKAQGRKSSSFSLPVKKRKKDDDEDEENAWARPRRIRLKRALFAVRPGCTLSRVQTSKLVFYPLNHFKSIDANCVLSNVGMLSEYRVSLDITGDPPIIGCCYSSFYWFYSWDLSPWMGTTQSTLL